MNHRDGYIPTFYVESRSLGFTSHLPKIYLDAEARHA